MKILRGTTWRYRAVHSRLLNAQSSPERKVRRTLKRNESKHSDPMLKHRHRYIYLDAQCSHVRWPSCDPSHHHCPVFLVCVRIVDFRHYCIPRRTRPYTVDHHNDLCSLPLHHPRPHTYLSRSRSLSKRSFPSSNPCSRLLLRTTHACMFHLRRKREEGRSDMVGTAG